MIRTRCFGHGPWPPTGHVQLAPRSRHGCPRGFFKQPRNPQSGVGRPRISTRLSSVQRQVVTEIALPGVHQPRRVTDETGPLAIDKREIRWRVLREPDARHREHALSGSRRARSAAFCRQITTRSSTVRTRTLRWGGITLGAAAMDSSAATVHVMVPSELPREATPIHAGGGGSSRGPRAPGRGSRGHRGSVARRGALRAQRPPRGAEAPVMGT